MTRIRDCKEEFYRKLHAIETIKEESWAVYFQHEDGKGEKPKYGLNEYSSNSPEVLELRAMLGITPPKDTARKEYVPTYVFNRRKLEARRNKLGYSNNYISVELGMHPGTFTNKLRMGKLSYDDVSRLEEILRLEPGELIIGGGIK